MKKNFILQCALALLILGIFAIGAVLGERSNEARFRSDARLKVQHDLSLTRDKLEQNLHGDLQLAKGLISVVALNPNLNQSQFEIAARPLFAGHSQLRNIGAAPGMVIRLMYPLEGNQAAVGLDYRKQANQLPAIELARETREVVLAGPLPLVQGGMGLVARFPVYLERTQGAEYFWGIVSVVIDADRLFDAAGLQEATPELDIALRGRDATGAQGETFFGDSTVFEHDAVVSTIALPHGSWQIGAVPKGGWPKHSDKLWTLRLFFVVTGLLILAVIATVMRSLRTVVIAKDALNESNLRLQLAIDTAHIAIHEWDVVKDQLKWDVRMYEFWGIAPGTPLTKELFLEGVHPDDRERVLADFTRLGKGAQQGTYTIQYRVINLLTKVQYWLEQYGQMVFAGGHPARFIGTVTDISERKRAEEELHQSEQRFQQLAQQDALTGIANRRHVVDLGEREFERSRRYGRPLSILMLDADHFKNINDEFGHQIGDHVLRELAQCCRMQLREADMLGRYGGEEFIFFLPETKLSEALLFAERLRLAISQLVISTNGDKAISVTVSIGVTSLVDGIQNLDQLIEQADQALYKAKSDGRNQVAWRE